MSFKMQLAREEGSHKILHACLATKAWLKNCKGRKPNPPTLKVNICHPTLLMHAIFLLPFSEPYQNLIEMDLNFRYNKARTLKMLMRELGTA